MRFDRLKRNTFFILLAIMLIAVLGQSIWHVTHCENGINSCYLCLSLASMSVFIPSLGIPILYFVIEIIADICPAIIASKNFCLNQNRAPPRTTF